jgi:hypothetical protein
MIPDTTFDFDTVILPPPVWVCIGFRTEFQAVSHRSTTMLRRTPYPHDEPRCARRRALRARLSGDRTELQMLAESLRDGEVQVFAPDQYWLRSSIIDWG